MKRNERSIKYLSQSLLLEEKANPLILQVLISFFVFVVTLFIIWAAYMEVDEVAIAPGKIVPIDEINKIQHLDGGVIKHVYVKDGDIVREGNKLIELDGEPIQALLKQNKSKLQSLLKKYSYVKEQVKIRSALYKKGLNSKMSFLSLQAQESELEGSIKETQEVVEHLNAQLEQLTITAPSDGIVHGLGNRTVKSIVGASEIIMEIIPKDRQLVAEVQISANDIGHIKQNQKAVLKFNTYDYGKYGGAIEVLATISPMTYLDPVNGRPFYKGRINLSSNFLGNTRKYPIIPGMTLTAEIQTGKKTILEYLLKPVYISAKNAMREK